MPLGNEQMSKKAPLMLAILKKLPEMDKAAYEETVHKFISPENKEHSAHD